MAFYSGGTTSDGTRPTVWDPGQYGQFADHRSRPFFDLVGRIGATEVSSVVDLGCGSGELTATLAARWPTATVVGVDNSSEMLSKATAFATDRVRFELGDLTSYRPPAETQVVVSNAAYQWVDGNEVILGEIAAALPAGGWLAVQVPGNFSAPSHRMIRGLVAQPRWQEATGGLRLREDPVLDPDGYADVYAAAGLVPDVWETTYSQLLHGADPVLEWVKGTALRPVLTALTDADLADFLAEMAPLLREAYPSRPFGTFFGFRRIFAVGHRPE